LGGINANAKAGSNITVTFAGKNQAAFFASCNIVDSDVSYPDPSKTPAIGTVAYIPTDYQDSHGNTAGYYSHYDSWYGNDYEFDGPPFTYSDTFTKAGDINFTIFYQKWTVVRDMITSGGAVIPNPDNPNGRIWEPDLTTRFSQLFKKNLLGVIYYYEDERGKTFKTVWVKNGAKYPKLTPKRKGFKFNGWYTNWPNGSKVKVGSAKVWFGNGYSKTLYVHWKKKIKFKFDANKGKIKGKKSFSVWYLKKTPKGPTAKRSGYHWLGWYNKFRSSGTTYYRLYKKGLLNDYDKAKITYKAQYIKKGKKKTISASEYNRILKTWNLGKKFIITRKAAKAAIGGGGLFVAEGYYLGIPAVRYEWNGTIDGSYVQITFATNGYYNNDILAVARYGPLK
jgi:hypothetical protein